MTNLIERIDQFLKLRDAATCSWKVQSYLEDSVFDMASCLEEAKKRILALEKALAGITESHVSLINSGDCGNWNPETENEVIAARAALSGEPT